MLFVKHFFYFFLFCGSDPHTTQVAIIGLGERPSGSPLDTYYSAWEHICQAFWEK